MGGFFFIDLLEQLTCDYTNRQRECRVLFIKSTKSINPSPASLPNEMMVMMCKKWEGGVTRVDYNGCLCSWNVLGSFLFLKMSVDYNQDLAGCPP